MKFTFTEWLNITELDESIEIHDTLNPLLWDGGDIKPEVNEALQEIVKVFTNYVGLPEHNISDVVLTGSNANFNYHENSDIDIHVEYTLGNLDCPIIDDFFNAKKSLWNNTHDIVIKDYQVELYAEDINSKNKNMLVKDSGVYSLFKNKWLVEPKKGEIPEVNDSAVQKKYKSIADQIDFIVNTKVTNMSSIDMLKANIRKLRASGIKKAGEYSVNNLAFKELRNNGYLEKLSTYVIDMIDSNLSLK